MKRFVWVSLISAVLIVIAAVMPEQAWSTVADLPAHPLIVHGLVVLIPLLSLFVIVGLFRISLLTKSYLFVIAGYGVLTAGVIAANTSGDALEQQVGVLEQHEDLGSVLVPVAIALFVSFTLFALFAFVLSMKSLAVVLAVLVGLQAGASIPLTIIVGHSGAESVWADVTTGAPSQDDREESEDEEYESSNELEGEARATTAPQAGASDRLITQDEVALHRTPDDCWTIVNGAVYDLTSFVGRHPGGRSAISQICGGDGTSVFGEQHAGQAAPESQLSSLKIGMLG